MNTPSATIIQSLWNNPNIVRNKQQLLVVGKVKSMVEAGLVRAARLRQSVLRSAFEGKLA